MGAGWGERYVKMMMLPHFVIFIGKTACEAAAVCHEKCLFLLCKC